MTSIRLISLLVCLTAASLVCSAQFYTSENEPSAKKWMSQRGYKFNVIYPEGCEAVARQYAQELERYRIPLGASLGFCGGDYQKRPIPVIIHSSNMASNGMVTWTPSRMELYSLPEWRNPSAMPWSKMLAIHEGRHFAQMQFGYRHVFRPLYWIFGQMIPGAACAYPDNLLLEGDAVVAETALSASGRGRNGRFLLRYMYSFDVGDYRDWTRWRLGSYYRPAPNHYAFGYFLISGLRVRYNAPLFMADYLDYVSRRPYDPWPLRHAMRRTGGKKFTGTFREITRFQYGLWAEDTLCRAPFDKVRPLLKKEKKRLHTYSNPIDMGRAGSVWKKSDLYGNTGLVLIDSLGRERRLTALEGVTGQVNHIDADTSFIWNEVRSDPRWKQKRYSVVRKYHFPSSVKKTVTRKGNSVYPGAFNDSLLTAISYCEDGGEWISAIGRDAGIRRLCRVPDTLQAIQQCVLDSEVFVTAISDGGMGIYRISERGEWKAVLPARPVQIMALSSSGSDLTFISDFNGVNELYRLSPDEGSLRCLTSGKFGGEDFALTSGGDVLVSRITRWGSEPGIIKADSLRPRTVNWDEYYRYPVADELSAQEERLSRQNVRTDGGKPFDSPVKYRKAAHALRVHSWAPLYTDVSAITSASVDILKHPADLGAMAFFQNDQSTFSGYVGYSAARDKNRDWHHAGHINLTYKGLYPVFELDAHFGESYASEYFYNEAGDTLFVRSSQRPLLRGGLKTYVPLSWSDNAALYGVIPSVGLKYHNNTLQGRTTLLLNASLRGYVMSHTPEGCIYPKWGIGAEASYNQPFAYLYLYGYVPGVCLGQGLRVTAVNQWVVDERAVFIDKFVNVVPRGFQSIRLYSGSKLTLDYAIPFYMGDWHIGTAFYCKRGIFTPHFDYAVNHKGGALGSAGCSLELEFGSFFWVRTPVTVGVSFSANTWRGFENTEGFEKTYAGLLFNISIPN